VTSPRYDWAEPVLLRRRPVLATVLVTFALLAWRLGAHADLPAYLYLAAVGTVLAFVDVALFRLPDRLTLPSYPIMAALLGLAAVFTGQGGTRYLHALYGMAAFFLLYAAQWIIVPGQIGLGDVKLAGVLGLALGWLGLGACIAGVFAIHLLGGLYSLVMLVTRKATLKSSIPFGPFMLAGTLLAILLYG
jgi:leader peptidase (prepilin peptidase) / N-methyltransferase